ncbi:hypothetical protein ATI61_1205 [Archangium gephyra]|uniref:Uncharacterized protein n=1 Tax=Archangium gephyra TaxID=48 RepID=A0AAC8TC78_9BACT|nr:hypothetical protein [Archangium gephyra]AKJ00600.1 Hypothetical protein AA314_02226 [Archangium gephyra]REG20651.1 hypothetical protein ATI61_1205 [Archangium gephyra]
MNDFESLRDSREAGHPAARALETLAFAPEGTPRAAEVEEHVRACASCQARVAALREERARFLQARPARAFAARIEEKARRVPWWRRPVWAFGALPAAVAVALVLLVVLPRAVPREEETGDGLPVRLKGAPAVRLEVLVSREGQPAVPFREGEPLLPVDALRFRVTLPERGFVFIANQDGAGRFTRYFPASGSRGVPLEPGEHLLPGGVVLDDWRGEERITLLFSPGPLEERDVEAALRRAFERAGGLHFEDTGLPGQSVAHFHRKGTR